MIEALTKYLGRPVSFLLKDVPFKDWRFDRTIETDLDEPIIAYVFAENGLELNCDGDDKINTIFLHGDKFNSNYFASTVLLISSHRQEILDLYGVPSKSGGPFSHPILGVRGEFDRFLYEKFCLHFQYYPKCDRVEMITLMTLDVTP